jgi:hypothetical protein
MGRNKRWVSRFEGQEMRDGGRQGHLLRAGESRARAKGGKGNGEKTGLGNGRGE